MRDRVFAKFSRQEYPLLPTFGVMDAFEDRCGALTAHLLALTNGTATLRSRATLVFLAMKAAREADGGLSVDMSVQNTMEAMFEAGAADNELMLKEVELIERLLYTPAQYQAKKEARERQEAAQIEMENILSAFPAFSDSPQQASDGLPPSSGDQPPESSSPA